MSKKNPDYVMSEAQARLLEATSDGPRDFSELKADLDGRVSPRALGILVDQGYLDRRVDTDTRIKSWVATKAGLAALKEYEAIPASA